MDLTALRAMRDAIAAGDVRAADAGVSDLRVYCLGSTWYSGLRHDRWHCELRLADDELGRPAAQGMGADVIDAIVSALDRIIEEESGE